MHPLPQNHKNSYQSTILRISQEMKALQLKLSELQNTFSRLIATDSNKSSWGVQKPRVTPGPTKSVTRSGSHNKPSYKTKQNNNPQNQQNQQNQKFQKHQNNREII